MTCKRSPAFFAEFGLVAYGADGTVRWTQSIRSHSGVDRPQRLSPWSQVEMPRLFAVP